MSSATTTELNATTRETIGKAGHKLIALDQMAGVVYGAGVEATPVTVDRHAFERLMAHVSVGSLLKLTIDGGKPLNVIIKEVQTDPVKGTPLHVDFWAVKMDQAISTVVPITFVGSSVGEREGGILLHELRELHIEALPGDIPEHIEVDVSDLEIGSSFTVGDLTPPKGVTLHADPETVIAAVTAPTIEEEVEEEAELEEGAEVPEVGEEEAETEAEEE
ncbi:MAG: 50S ribosomal protein L25 [Coriobacteriia bacterium]